MKKSEYIYEIVKSLSKKEKQVFRMLASDNDGKSKAYVELYSAIEKLSSYDEAALKKKLAKKSWIRNFASVKSYLYKALLKALRYAHSEDGLRAEIVNHTTNHRILDQKGLAKIAMDELAKAQYLAKEKLQSDSLLIPILADRNNCLMADKFPGLSEEQVDDRFIQRDDDNVRDSRLRSMLLSFFPIDAKLEHYGYSG